MDVFEEEREMTIRGSVVDIIFENDDNGYKICDVLCEGKIPITARGVMPFLFLGEVVTLTGHYENHKVYGDQFIVTSYTKEIPSNTEDTELFLSSGLIDGVGAATAKAIVKKFGADTVSVILNDPSRLESVKGITHPRALRIAETFQEYQQMSDLVVFFNKYGIPTNLALKVYQCYGALSIETVRKNPYALIDDIPEIGFKTADRIGMSIGVGFDDGSRVGAGILYILNLAMGNGHVYLPKEQLIRETALLLEIAEAEVRQGITSLLAQNRIVRKGPENGIFLSYLDECEAYVAGRLQFLSGRKFPVEETAFQKNIRDFETENGISLDESQRFAVLQSAENGFSIITGGPGTGKTTIIKALVRFLSGRKKKCVLAAPTGRAAKRMSEACGLPAKTIHRLLEFNAGISGSDGEARDDFHLRFNRNVSNPIDANVLIVDETSMLDLLLLYHLLKAVPAQTQLIFVGDQDQLPSVGPGNVLKDLIRSGKFSTVILHNIYRQETESLIAHNAHRIHVGELPVLNVKDRDFFLLPRKTPNEAMQTMLDVVTRRLPQTYGIDPMRDVQVLIPNKKGICGVINANALLQEALNPPEPHKAEYRNGNGVFRKGDRVMQIRNNYDISWEKRNQLGVDGQGIFNGEMGIIEEIDLKNRVISILFDEDRLAEYDYPAMSQIEHCYAITVHKSQGSEFDYCVIPLMPGPPMLMTRNILYTAITRARKMVVLIGSGDCIALMVGNNTEQKRCTYLTERLTGGESVCT